jgi:hypothetical protein
VAIGGTVLALSRHSHTVVFPKEGQLRVLVAGQASRSKKFAIFWAADNRNNLPFDLEGYLRKLAFRVTSFGTTTIYVRWHVTRGMPYELAKRGFDGAQGADMGLGDDPLELAISQQGDEQ